MQNSMALFAFPALSQNIFSAIFYPKLQNCQAEIWNLQRWTEHLFIYLFINFILIWRKS